MKIPDQMKIVLHKEIALMHYQFMMERVCKVLLLGITIHGRRLRGGGVIRCDRPPSFCVLCPFYLLQKI